MFILYYWAWFGIFRTSLLRCSKRIFLIKFFSWNTKSTLANDTVLGGDWPFVFVLFCFVFWYSRIWPNIFCLKFFLVNLDFCFNGIEYIGRLITSLLNSFNYAVDKILTKSYEIPYLDVLVLDKISCLWLSYTHVFFCFDFV